MDTQNEEVKNVDQETDTNEEETTDQVEEKTEEEVTWEEKFQKQSSNAQRTITQANEKLFSVHSKLVEKDQQHLVELAGGDDKDVKLAKKLAKDIFKAPLDKVLDEIRPPEENVEQLEARLRTEVERKVNREASYNVFINNNSMLDEKSSDYNEEVKTRFDEKVERLMDKGIVTLEEAAETLNDAYYLASRNQGNTERTQERIASAGSGGGMSNITPSSNKGVREVEDEMSKYGISLSKEAKKLMQQGKI
jgi:hypothetical protein